MIRIILFLFSFVFSLFQIGCGGAYEQLNDSELGLSAQKNAPKPIRLQTAAAAEDAFYIPKDAVFFDDFSKGLHFLQLFHRAGSRADELSPPPMVKIDGKLAVKAAVRFTGGNHFLIYRADPQPRNWQGFKELVAIVRSGDDVEAQVYAGIEQFGAAYSSAKYALEATRKDWSRLVIPLDEIRDRSGAAPDLSGSVKSVYLVLDRARNQQPDPPVEKVIYLAAFFLSR
jgi:hypothetical protein